MRNQVAYQRKTGQANELREIVLDKLSEIIQEWMDTKKYGYIQINFADGVVAALNLYESMKLTIEKRN